MARSKVDQSRLRNGFGGSLVLRGSQKALSMSDRPAETVLRDIGGLFRLGVVSGMSDGELLERFAAQAGSDSELAFEAIVRRPRAHGSGRLPPRAGRPSRRPKWPCAILGRFR